jgi:hypothetical protein
MNFSKSRALANFCCRAVVPFTRQPAAQSVIVIGPVVENLIFRTIERNTVQKWAPSRDRHRRHACASRTVRSMG